MTKLPEYQDFQAPWEKKGSEIDPEKAKRFLYTLLKQNEGLEDKVANVTAERDDFKGKVDAIARKDETEVERLKRELEEAKSGEGKADPVEVLKLRVALKKGLSETQAKRLVGSTEAELEADAEELVASFGSNGKPGEEDGDKGGDTHLRRTPNRLNNSGDPDEGAGPELTWDKVADKIPRL